MISVTALLHIFKEHSSYDYPVSVFCEFLWLWNTWRLDKIWSFPANWISWFEKITYFALNGLEMMSTCNCPGYSSMAVVTVIPSLKYNDLNLSSSMSMSLLFSTYYSMTTFTNKKCASNLPCPVFASVKTHCLFEGPEDTTLKLNKNGKICCEEKHITL